MNRNLTLQYKNSSREEYHSQRADSFPYIQIHSVIEDYANSVVPWHWHEDVELFYIEHGVLEYHIPGKTYIFPEGSGGMINSSVLHLSTPAEGSCETRELLHIFDPDMLAGCDQIQKKYIDPITKNPGIRMISILPDTEEHQELLKFLAETFQLREDAKTFDTTIQNRLSESWLRLLPIAEAQAANTFASGDKENRLKTMMVVIYEHFADKINVSDIANAAFTSERECYRLFKNGLDTSPMDYLKDYRIQQACDLLKNSAQDLTSIGIACGFGSGSYFTQTFKDALRMTPSQYRKKT